MLLLFPKSTKTSEANINIPGKTNKIYLAVNVLAYIADTTNGKKDHRNNSATSDYGFHLSLRWSKLR